MHPEVEFKNSIRVRGFYFNLDFHSHFVADSIPLRGDDYINLSYLVTALLGKKGLEVTINTLSDLYVAYRDPVL